MKALAQIAGTPDFHAKPPIFLNPQPGRPSKMTDSKNSFLVDFCEAFHFLALDDASAK
jgi:hypothetical protein